MKELTREEAKRKIPPEQGSAARPNKWLLIRLLILCFWIGEGFLVSPNADAGPWRGIAFVFFGPLLLLLIQFWIGHMRKSSPYTWRKPSWRESPFSWREPLHFFDFVGVCFMAFGLVWLIRTPWHLVSGAPAPLFVLAVGCGVWASVNLFYLIVVKDKAPGSVHHS